MFALGSTEKNIPEPGEILGDPLAGFESFNHFFSKQVPVLEKDLAEDAAQCYSGSLRSATSAVASKAPSPHSKSKAQTMGLVHIIDNATGATSGTSNLNQADSITITITNRVVQLQDDILSTLGLLKEKKPAFDTAVLGPCLGEYHGQSGFGSAAVFNEAFGKHDCSALGCVS
ncbi:hypothetical protein BJY01DRAFT_254816 [Aspergillus pseudoustus]|uniref:Uncharacterized protein n=1 Tax=Aspergillus pseudoustus TaxID=1810923 RepID=A0ABR4IQ95_9EURO